MSLFLCVSVLSQSNNFWTLGLTIGLGTQPNFRFKIGVLFDHSVCECVCVSLFRVEKREEDSDYDDLVSKKVPDSKLIFDFNVFSIYPEDGNYIKTILLHTSARFPDI